MQKRISAFVIAGLMVVMFVMIVPVSVFSQGNNIADSTINDVKPLYEENEETVYDKVGIYENLKYGIKDGSVTIIGYVGDLDGELVIPETMGGYPVTTIGKGAFCGYPITSVSMPSVTTIGNIAFARCYYLTRISMPHIQTVTGSAFAACTSLAKIDLGSNNEYFITENNILYSKDKKILYYCYPSSSIKGNFEVDDNVTTIGEYAFYYNCDLTEISMQNVITIGDNAFYGCTDLKSVSIPNGTVIGNDAFNDCINLEDIDMQNVKTIGEGAFEGCNHLIRAEMPNVFEIGNDAFRNCDRIVRVSMPKIEKVTGSAFRCCSNLADIEIGNDNNYFTVENNILYSKDKKTLVLYSGKQAKGDIKINDNVTTIGEYAFYGCPELKNIELANVTEIGEYALACCDGAVRVDMPNVTTIEDKVFWSSSFTEISMPNVTTIGNGAFQECYNLRAISLPNVITIGNYAFDWCQCLERVDIYNVKTIGNSAFSECPRLKSVYFYCDAPTELGEDVFEHFLKDFSIYYLAGTNGWTTPEWNGYPTKKFVLNPNTQVMGDANGDEVLDSSDATEILRIVAQLEELKINEKYADVNGDGIIDSADATKILRYVAHLEQW